MHISKYFVREIGRHGCWETAKNTPIKDGGEKMDRNDMPVGFTMALGMNPDAMQKFATLSESQKRTIIEGTHAVQSKDEMQRYVDALANNKL